MITISGQPARSGCECGRVLSFSLSGMSSECTHCASLPTCAKGLRLTVPRSVHNGVPAESLLVSGVFTALVLVLRLRSSPCEVRRHAMSSIQSTMRTCTRGASGAGVSVPAARGIPNSRAPSCHLERACRLRLAAGWNGVLHLNQRKNLALFADVERECHRRLAWGGMSLNLSAPGSDRFWDPPSHRGTALRHALPGPDSSGWMDQIRDEGCEVLMSCEFRRSVHSYSY